MPPDAVSQPPSPRQTSAAPDQQPQSSEVADWRSPEGLTRLRQLVEPRLSFELHTWQAECAASILMLQDVVLITATGSGKSSLIYVPAFLQPDWIIVVIEPTNALEHDLVRQQHCLP